MIVPNGPLENSYLFVQEHATFRLLLSYGFGVLLPHEVSDTKPLFTLWHIFWGVKLAPLRAD